MPHTPEDNDPLKWHRYFAIECNNRAWDLSTSTRSPEDDEEMLNVAHASALHWQIAGNELNHMRACMLLAEVHALRGLGDTALLYAHRMERYFLNRETPDWEVAFTHAILAHAAFAAGDLALHRRAYADAVVAIEQIAEEAERKIVVQTFEHIPAP